jgi:hypothetical protein
MAHPHVDAYLPAVAFWTMPRPTHPDRCAPATDVIAQPEDLVCYCDGAYDQANEGGTQKGGFGFAAVTRGDGGTLTHTRTN